MNKNLILPSGRTLSDVVTGVTAQDRTTERSDAVFMARLLQEMYAQEPVCTVVQREKCTHDDDGYLTSRYKTNHLDRELHTIPLGPLYTRPIPADPIALDRVEGDLLPPIGEKVYIHLASSDSWVAHKVVGYYVWGPLRGVCDSYSRVFVRVIDDQGILNARLLKEVLWGIKLPLELSPSEVKPS